MKGSDVRVVGRFGVGGAVAAIRRGRAVLAAGLTVGLTLAGCDPVPRAPSTASLVHVHLAGTAIISSQTETLSPEEMRRVSDTTIDGAYRLGPDDVISVTVYLHPDLSVPQPGSATNVGGALITSDGTIELPLIGTVKLGGLTLAEASAEVTKDYGQYINDPKVAIELAEAQSLRYYLLGAFTTPGVKYPVHQLTLLEALALGGSVDLDKADLYQAYVAQGSVKLPVDLHALLVDGDLSQNIPLASGDAVVVPSSAAENAFVFGAVGKSGAVPFNAGALSLLQALAGADLDLANYTNARLARIHIIRAHGKSAQFFIVDARLILDGQAQSFTLEPGDIVFVPPDGIASWNQVLTELLPSLTTIADILNPFVSIRYLQTTK
jgi:polysaccharide export outer membrane protein